MATKIVILFQIFLILAFIAGIYVIIEFYARKEKEGITTNAECSNLLIRKGGKILLYNTEKPLEESKNPITFAHLDEYLQYLETQRSNGIQCPILFLNEETIDHNTVSYTITTPPGAGDLFQPTPSTTHTPSTENLENPASDERNRPAFAIPTHFHMNTMKPYNDTGEKRFLYSVTGFITNNFTKPFSDFVLSNSSFAENMANGGQQPIEAVDASRESTIYNQGVYPGFDPTSQYQGTYTNIDAIHDSTAQQNMSDNPMDTNWGGVIYTQDQVNSGKYDDYNIFRPSLVQPKFSYGLNKNPVGGPVDILEPEKSPQPFTPGPPEMAPVQEEQQ
jgi:hypothetical protein